jgi:phosphoglycolate phosphatase-like HAD superfamily hydrolase
MIGDTITDLKVAEACNVASVCVTFGYASPSRPLPQPKSSSVPALPALAN